MNNTKPLTNILNKISGAIASIAIGALSYISVIALTLIFSFGIIGDTSDYGAKFQAFWYLLLMSLASAVYILTAVSLSLSLKDKPVFSRALLYTTIVLVITSYIILVVYELSLPSTARIIFLP